MREVTYRAFPDGTQVLEVITTPEPAATADKQLDAESFTATA
jgi:hypothetical protein